MYGLMKITEQDDTNLQRRNNMLDHLLARHGESPLLIDAYINGSVYSGIALQDQVIFKSLYLQNYARISYNQVKGYNFQGADAMGSNTKPGGMDMHAGIFEEDSIDFIIQSGKINRVEKITAEDLINYSAVELKLCLLFGLRPLYKNFIAANVPTLSEEVKSQARWLITKRRGCIMIETGLLFQSLWPYDKNNGRELEKEFFESVFQSHVLFVFPGYIPQLKTNEFKNRLNLFLQNELPVTVKYTVLHIDGCLLLDALISAFILWHDIIRSQPGEADPGQQSKHATELITKLKTAVVFFQKK
jgi:hypothetical protein